MTASASWPPIAGRWRPADDVQSDLSRTAALCHGSTHDIRRCLEHAFWPGGDNTAPFLLVGPDGTRYGLEMWPCGKFGAGKEGNYPEARVIKRVMGISPNLSETRLLPIPRFR